MPLAEHELQLEVWKELAVGKQMLMSIAARALKLDPEYSEDQLKAAIEKLLKQKNDAEASATASRERARTSILEMEHKVAASEQARIKAEASLAQMRAFKQKEAPMLAAERAAAANELKKVKDQLAEKDKAIKAITAALADSPENVLRKLKDLKKQKLAEADARKALEASLNTIRQENRELDQKAKAARADGGKLAAKYRELHEISTKLHEQLTPRVADAEALPELDSALVDKMTAKD